MKKNTTTKPSGWWLLFIVIPLTPVVWHILTAVGMAMGLALILLMVSSVVFYLVMNVSTVFKALGHMAIVTGVAVVILFAIGFINYLTSI